MIKASFPAEAAGRGASKLDPLTSLRLFAALVVIFHHARGFLLPASMRFPASEAVTFFFVLSGFIMVYVYRGRDYSLPSYYVARVARIFPASLLALGVLAILLPPGNYLPYSAGGGPVDTTSVVATNVLLLQSLIPVPAYYFALNAVAWSVSVELFFYAFFPFFLRLLSHRRGRLIVCALAVCTGAGITALAAYFRYPDFSDQTMHAVTWHGLVYVSPISRLKEFLIGMFAGAAFLRLRPRIVVSLSRINFYSAVEFLAVASVFFLVPRLESRSQWIADKIGFAAPQVGLYLSQASVACLFAVVIFVFAIQGGILSKVLSLKPLVIGGEISFSIYLFHQILITWLSRQPWFLEWIPPVLRVPVVLVVIVMVSYGVWRWYERPARTLLRRLLDRA